MGTKAAVVTDHSDCSLLQWSAMAAGSLEDNQTNSSLLSQSREDSEESGKTWMLEVSGEDKDEVLRNCLRNYHAVASMHNCWLMLQLTHQAAGSGDGGQLAHTVAMSWHNGLLAKRKKVACCTDSWRRPPELKIKCLAQSVSHHRGLSNLPLEPPSFPDTPSPLPTFSRRSLLQAVSTNEKESYHISAIQNFHSFDPFADASKGNDLLPADTEDYIHIRTQQRNGRKTLTTVQGIADDYDKKKLVKAFKKKFACNGTVIEHPEYGEVIQLQGDQRKNICQFLVEIGLAKDDQLKVHGF
ncbi:uncharacterized protein LOC119046883 [Artibeus jamaicensis]|uniref:uncharacterized protein LOC119046883 n=1 Tax=Artibeus jamaicensis TaxID=9417 RepID=UPI00235AF56D|nr:uncharacterized protein LOC119046883 [Artibeus jamaicensis]